MKGTSKTSKCALCVLGQKQLVKVSPDFSPSPTKLRDSANKCRGNQEGGERKNSSVALLSPPHHISGIQSEVVYGLSASRQRGAEPLDADAGALTLSKTLTFVLRHQIQSSREGRQLTFKICLHTFTILPCSQRYHSLDFPRPARRSPSAFPSWPLNKITLARECASLLHFHGAHYDLVISILPP